ncbi:MAG TPA: efflux RND transporter periplasmic adaptor subunit [Candidatus Binatia bacterium]|jgi:multidrug efflux system membrane fusion protein
MRRSFWVIGLLIVVGGFAGFQQYSSWSLNRPQADSQTKSDNPATEKPGAQNRAGGRARGSGEAVPVTVATAVRKNVPVQIRAVGNVEPYSTVSIKSQVTGVITQAHFREGQDVKKGQLLFTIDPRPLEAALKQAEANLARDAAQLNNWREQVKRYRELVDKQYVSKEQYDQIKTNADAAEAVVDADQAAVENAKVQLSYCYIYSPVNGRVGSLLVNEGNLVRVNDGTPLLVINQLVPINVSFSVPEQYLADIKQRMAAGKLGVDATFPSDEARPERGVLAFVDNAVDRTTGTIKLKAEFKNSDLRLWPGQYTNVALTLSTQAGAVVVPSDAIQVGPDGQQVFVVKEDKRVEIRLVAVGQSQEGESIITKGLAAGEVVVREGQFLLGPNSRVEIKTANVDSSNSGGGQDEVPRGGGERGKTKNKADARGAS